MTSLPELARDRSIVICAGPGGVGKTTTAAAIAVEGARLGRRTCVVTIDPAKRLADALGLDRLTNEPGLVDGDWEAPGELWALMLDTKSTFDDLVTRYAATPRQAEGILGNRLYRNISSALSGTQEYMAMEKLYELHDGGALRPDRGRHPADPQRPRLPRRSPPADPLPRQPRLPPAHDADPGLPAGRERGHPGFPADGLQGGRLRGGRRRRRLLRRLRGHGAGLPRPGRAGLRAAAPTRAPPSCWWPPPAATPSTRRSTSPSASGTPIYGSKPWSSTGSIPASDRQSR